MSKAPKIARPLRDPDHTSKRGVYYWWAPEWTRGTSARNDAFSKIKAIRSREDVSLYMQAKDGNLTYIQGSIQREFRDWHIDRQIDYILLGETPESASDMIINETEEFKL